MPQPRTYRVVRPVKRSRVGVEGSEGTADPSRLAEWEAEHEARVKAHQARVAAEAPGPRVAADPEQAEADRRAREQQRRKRLWEPRRQRLMVKAARLLAACGPLTRLELCRAIGLCPGHSGRVLGCDWFCIRDRRVELTPAGLAALAATEEG